MISFFLRRRFGLDVANTAGTAKFLGSNLTGL